MSTPQVAQPVIEVKNLSLEFHTQSGTVQVLENISVQVYPGEMLGIAGESGSGKSVLAYALMGILDPSAKITSGSIWLEGRDLLALPPNERKVYTSKSLSMIFQNPKAALNPIRSVGHQLEDVLERQGSHTRRELKKLALLSLEEVKIPDPERRYKAYPFELSGGMAQRIMIAIALACKPKLMIADEPSTGLDVTTQAAIMQLIRGLCREKEMAVFFITHDLALASEYCNRLGVMHAGHLVELGPSAELFGAPRHPYTTKLLSATLTKVHDLKEVEAIPGGLPDLRRNDLPPCRFLERCDKALAKCRTDSPPWTSNASGHRVFCWHESARYPEKDVT